MRKADSALKMVLTYFLFFISCSVELINVNGSKGKDKNGITSK